MGRLQPNGIVAPALRQIERVIDEGMATTRHIGRKHADLAVRDLPGRARILPRHTARCLALLQKAGLVDDQHRIIMSEMLDDIIAYEIAQRIGIPAITPQKLLLAPWTGIARCLCPHPTGLAPFLAEQSVNKRASARRRALLRKQRPYPSLNVAQGRCPQLECRLNRASGHP